MNPVVQEEKTGCAIASSAVLAGVSYATAKGVANRLGIFAEDEALWSETAFVRQLLAQFKIKLDEKETPFTRWDRLPDWSALIKTEGFKLLFSQAPVLRNLQDYDS